MQSQYRALHQSASRVKTKENLTKLNYDALYRYCMHRFNAVLSDVLYIVLKCRYETAHSVTN